MQQYSLIRKPYLILSTIAIIIFFAISFLTSYPSWKLMSYKFILSIYVVIALIIFIEVFLRQFLHYMFTMPNRLWRQEIDKPRLLCYLFSFFFIYISYNSILERGEGVQYWISAITALVSLILGILLLGIMWSEKFERIFIRKIRESLTNPYSFKCIINSKEYNTNKILEEFDGLNCSVEVFNALINQQQVNLEERIKSRYEKAHLIRLVYILFSMKYFEPKIKRYFINSYFITEEGDDFIREYEATFARIDQEVLNEDKKYINLKDSLLTIFEKKQDTVKKSLK